MFDRKSTALASFFALALVGFSGHLVSANAEPANAPAAKVYADNTTPSGSVGMMPVQADQKMTKDRSPWESAPAPYPVAGTDLRFRTGFFGYR
jgi:hypothetical protein